MDWSLFFTPDHICLATWRMVTSATYCQTNASSNHGIQIESNAFGMFDIRDRKTAEFIISIFSFCLKAPMQLFLAHTVFFLYITKKNDFSHVFEFK